MKVIVTYRNFHDIDKREIMPEVFSVNNNETPEMALRRIWEDHYNAELAESEFDGVCELHKEGCWLKKDTAMITWIDGDTKEFYVIDIENYGE